ncbi:ABC transporter permease [Terasakiella pusilla]|uniref:ABC transporter permease n=1 Tax=Terasakiella pusilla TaxID=64973 RepID=UPI00048C5098|nr:ABC transporter permease [Terasakiella pusilla]
MNVLYKILAERIFFGLFSLFAVSVIIFFAVELMPGDLAEAILGQSATPENLAAFRKQLGLDQPAFTRFFSWLSGAMVGDFGVSFANQRDVADLILGRLSNTLFLAALAAVISIPLAVTLGILAALYRNTLFDRIVNVSALTSVSFPEFFVAYILIYVFSIQLGLFPSMSSPNPDAPFWDKVFSAILPVMTLVLVVMAQMMRMTRSALINLLASPYIEMARLKGMKQSRVILFHAVPNALAPIANVIALNMAYLIAGVVVVEVVFVYPGLGQLLVDSVSKRDLPVVQACSLIFAVTYITLNTVADVISILSNPRLMHPR